MHFTQQILKDLSRPTALSGELSMESRLNTERSATRASELGGELELMRTQADALNNAYVQLESFGPLIEQSLEDESLGVELEHAYRMTLESLFGAEYAKQAEFSQEGLLESLKYLGQGLANLKGRMKRSMKDFMSALRGGSHELALRSESVLAHLDDLDRDAKARKDTLKIGGGSRLHIGGTMKPETLVKELPDAVAASLGFMHQTTEFGRALFDHAYGVLRAIGKLGKGTDKATIKEMQHNARVEAEDLIEAQVASIKDMGNQALPGGHRLNVEVRALYRVMYADGKKEALRIPTLFNQNATGRYKEKEKVPAPTPDQIRAMATQAKTMAETGATVMAKAMELLVEADEIAVARHNVPKIKKGLDPQRVGNLNDLIVEALVTMAQNYFGNGLKLWAEYVWSSLMQMNNYLFQTNRALVEYCEIATENYTK